MDLEAIIRKIENGKVGVMPTDTLYALAGSALKEASVNRIYRIKRRDSSKPLITIIGSVSDLGLFGISLKKRPESILRHLWPGKVSVVIPIDDGCFRCLHRGKKSLAFRMPDDKELLDLLSKTGPLAVPSANPEGLPPARTIEEARKYFGDSVDFYWDKGRLEGEPSTLIRIKPEGFEILRAGAYEPERLKNELS